MSAPTIGTVIDELFNQLALRHLDVGRFRFVAAIGGDGDSWWFRADGLYVARGLQPRKIVVSDKLLVVEIGASRVPQELIENFASNLVETLIAKMNEAQMANV